MSLSVLFWPAVQTLEICHRYHFCPGSPLLLNNECWDELRQVLRCSSWVSDEAIFVGVILIGWSLLVRRMERCLITLFLSSSWISLDQSVMRYFVRSFNTLQLIREPPFKRFHNSNKSKYILNITKEAKSFSPTLDFYFPIISPNSKVCVNLDLKVFFLIWEDSCMLWDIWVDCSSISLCITVLVSIVTILLAK